MAGSRVMTFPVTRFLAGTSSAVISPLPMSSARAMDTCWGRSEGRLSIFQAYFKTVGRATAISVPGSRVVQALKHGVSRIRNRLAERRCGSLQVSRAFRATQDQHWNLHRLEDAHFPVHATHDVEVIAHRRQ